MIIIKVEEQMANIKASESGILGKSYILKSRLESVQGACKADFYGL